MKTLMEKIDFQMEEYERLTNLIREDGLVVCFHHAHNPTHISVWLRGDCGTHAASFKIENNEIITLSEGRYKGYTKLMKKMLLPLTQPYEEPIDEAVPLENV